MDLTHGPVPGLRERLDPPQSVREGSAGISGCWCPLERGGGSSHAQGARCVMSQMPPPQEPSPP